MDGDGDVDADDRILIDAYGLPADQWYFSFEGSIIVEYKNPAGGISHVNKPVVVEYLLR